MLEISKVQFVEKADEHRPNVTRILGKIKIHVEVCVDEQENVPRNIVHDNIREEIWHKVYGDLRKLLAELQRHAIREARPEYSYRVQELCEQINALLALKSPNDQAQARRTVGVDCK